MGLQVSVSKKCLCGWARDEWLPLCHNGWWSVIHKVDGTMDCTRGILKPKWMQYGVQFVV